MRMKASDVGEWLRQRASKRDHREVVPDDDYLVLRPGRTSISSSACSTIQRPLNLDRWHLNEAQRAMVEAKMATRHGGGRRGGCGGEQATHLPLDPTKSPAS